MIVVDSSVVVSAVADGSDPGERRRGKLRGMRLAAPDLMRVECLSALRRHEAIGDLNADQAHEAMTTVLSLPVTVYPTAPLLTRAWQLRGNLTTYNACYVALAEILDCPLVTADRRLAAAPGIGCPVEVI